MARTYKKITDEICEITDVNTGKVNKKELEESKGKLVAQIAEIDRALAVFK